MNNSLKYFNIFTKADRANIEYPNFPKWTFHYPCDNHNQCYPYEFNALPGIYQIEVWGAQGGNTTNGIGGFGGYSKGILTLTSISKLFLHIGGTGNFTLESGIQFGGYNGGGNGYRDNPPHSNTYFGAGGGGSTDIRIEIDSLYNRVIVGGGGGGAGSGSASTGFGGGLNGNPGFLTSSDPRNFSTSGGNQTHGGVYTCIGSSLECRDIDESDGSFGQGGRSSQFSSGWSSGGGGGGYYGGASGIVWGFSGSGGSGFMYKSSSTVPNNFRLHSRYYLTNAITLAGNESIPSPYSNEYKIGHCGNGVARITLLEIFENPEFSQLYCNNFTFYKYSIVLFLLNLMLI